MIDEVTSAITRVVLAAGIVCLVLGLTIDPLQSVQIALLCWIAWSIDRVRVAIQRRPK